jgi:hypothetical protein
MTGRAGMVSPSLSGDDLGETIPGAAIDPGQFMTSVLNERIAL